jgi:hypothetical protein
MDFFRQVGVDLDQLVDFILDFQQRFGIVIGLQCLFVGCRGGDLLTDHDYR